MKSFKRLQKVICLIISLLMLASLLGGCQISITTESSSSSQASKSSSASTEEFAAKYKDYEIDFDEYKMITFYVISGLAEKVQSLMEKDNLTLEEFVRSGSFEGQPAASWIKQNSLEYAKLALVAREKLKTLGKDLSPERKKALTKDLEGEKFLEFSKIYNISLNAVKEALYDHVRILTLKQENIDVSDSELGEVTVNEDVIEKIDIFDLAKSAQNFWTKQVWDFS